MEYGIVETDKATAEEGETVTLTVTPEEGFELESISAVTYTDNDSDTPMLAPRRAPVISGEVTLTQSTENPLVYTFIMPANNVRISATFTPEAAKRYITVKKQWTVFCSPEDLTFEAGQGLKVYTIKAVTAPEGATEGTITLVQQDYIAKGVPMVLENTAYTTTKRYEILSGTGTAIAEADKYSGFKGSDEGASVLDASNTNYVLKNGYFVRTTATQVAQYSCYLEFTAPVTARSFFFDFEESNTTGINQVESSKLKADSYYDLMGRKVANPTKGVYIHNGKKVVIK
jgi:hypothetical protein